MVYANIFLAVIIGVLRILGHKQIAFQAIAHIVVGGYLGAWLVSRKPWYRWRGVSDHPAYGWLALGLSLLEMACFCLKL